VNWNCPVPQVGLVGYASSETRKETPNRMKTGNVFRTKKSLLATALLASSTVVLSFSAGVPAAAQVAVPLSTGALSAPTTPAPAGLKVASQSFSLPLFFEPNQGQTDPQVKFLSRGSGYGLFLTSDEAVLELHRSSKQQQATVNSVIRMRLDGASSSANVLGSSPLAGKSNYFIGNDPSKWRQNVPQFGRVEYQAIYPGVDLVYYGNQGQLEYDFRVAPNADPGKIALSFSGATTKIDAGNLVLSTANGDIRFHAPRVYQPALAQSTKSAAGDEKTIGEAKVAGSFRQLADGKIGFAIGDYDRSRELVIDPVLAYSSYLGGSKTEGNVQVAVDSGGLIYLAGSTTSSDFPSSATNNPNNLAFQPQIAGEQNVFIAVINSSLVPPTYSDSQQLVYATYLGGNGIDTPTGLAVDGAFSIYVGGYTTSSNFPFTLNAFQRTATEAPGNTHGFVTKIAFGANGAATNTYAPAYSSYLSGSGTDRVTGLAIDATKQNVYLTGDTTSQDAASNGFPANPNGYQITSNAAPGDSQFFATEINTSGSGPNSILYSTYFGGGNPAGATATGGGIAVDPTSSSVNMYITGTTNMLPTAGTDGEAPFPLLDAQQSCLNGASKVSNCPTPGTNTDAFVAKFNPTVPSTASLVYSTYVGGSGTDAGLAIAVDSSSDAYIGGSTNSTDLTCTTSCGAISFDGTYTGTGGNSNGLVVRINNQVNGIFPISYFTYIGGGGPDSVNSLQVDSLQAVHVVGSTFGGLPVTDSPYAYGGGGDAFVGVISTSLSGVGVGDYLTYIGGNQLDQGTGVAVDAFNATYVAGNTISENFPVTSNPFQAALNSGSQDAFVSKMGSVSQVVVSNSPSSPSPNPVNNGAQAEFTFLITNLGPDNASQVNFYALLPNGLGTTSTATVRNGTGTCGTLIGTTINCFFPTLTATTCTQGVTCPSSASVEVDVTPLSTENLTSISVSGEVGANGGPVGLPQSQSVDVVDFKVVASSPNPNPINAGDSTVITVEFCPTQPNFGYSGTITPTQTTSPSMVTASTPTFNPTTVVLSGGACGTTALTIATVARPVNTGSLLHRGPLYATWLPIGGVSLLGLGIGAGKKRRRWLAGALLGGLLGVIMLQLACGSSSTSATATGGTVAQTYTITISGSAGTGSSHNQQVQLVVH
jgi:uncharacterized repeat protein (TIGR01451 family)